MTLKTRILCVDFDGVLHSYTSGWKGVDVVADPPVPGAIEWLAEMVKNFTVNIYSSRSRELIGVVAMKEWLRRNGCPADVFGKLGFPTQKPAAFLTIDDRAICFDGVFPEADEIGRFQPWNKRVG
jgi:hypothetical protein